jgi:hypothetical protein
MHIQRRNKTTFLLYLLLFEKQFHMKLTSNIERASQFSKQNSTIIRNTYNLAPTVVSIPLKLKISQFF